MPVLCGAILLTGCSQTEGGFPEQSDVPVLKWTKEELDVQSAYQNSLVLDQQWENYGIGDPYIMKYNGVYYLYVSTPYGKTGIKAWSSENGFDWAYRGLLAEDQDATFTAYSPKVVYSNGTFYLYTTPNGNGLHVLTGTSPLGPFTDVTGRMHDSIDACIFIDDDGTWYLGHGHAGDGIEYHKMISPTELEMRAYYPGAVALGNGGNNWTETGEIFKRDNTYFMTYSGNHVANDSYRTLWASSDEVLSGYVAGERPLLTSTDGTLKGTGCGLVFTGADLMTDYVVYHNLINPNVGPIRALNIDRVTYNGQEMNAFGPTDFMQEKGRMPSKYDYLKTADHFTNLNSVSDGLGYVSAGKKAEFEYPAEKDYVAEMNYRAGGDAVIGASSEAIRLMVAADGTLKLRLKSETFTETVKGYVADALHNVKIDFRHDRLQIYIDGMRKFDLNTPSEGGKLSYTFTDDGMIGYTALSQDEEDISEVFMPYTGKIFAKDYAKEYSSSALTLVDGGRNGDALHVKSGEYARYRVNAGKEKTFNLSVTYRAKADGKLAAVAKDGRVEGGFAFASTDGKYVDGALGNVTLGEFYDLLTLSVLEGEADIYAFRLYPTEEIAQEVTVSTISDEGFTELDGKWTALSGRVKSYDLRNQEQANLIYGSKKWSDYEVHVKIAVDRGSIGKAGVLVRAANIAPNTGTKQQIFAYNDQSYYVYLDSNGNVGIDKHNYNSVNLVTENAFDKALDKVELSVLVKNNEIVVKVNGKTVLSYYDVENPYLTGKVGLHSESCTATYTEFSVKGV
ncbi:MAG: family 43 glycosylhydrolase [Clostridiales bacterium]|nr:family 43 glycosylhydrolase [Clostridiales bacterium]